MHHLMSFLNANSSAFTLLCTIFLTLITARYVLLTQKLVEEARLTREAQSRPKIMMMIVARDDEMHWIDLITKNIGQSYAYDVHFKIESDLSLGGTGFHGAAPNLSDVGYIARGIPSFAPEQKLQFFLTSILGTLEEKSRNPVKVKVTYRDATNKTYVDEYVLDFGMFKHMGYLGKPPMETIADSLEKMQKDLRNVATSCSVVSAYYKGRAKRRSKQSPELILPNGLTHDDRNYGSF